MLRAIRALFPEVKILGADNIAKTTRAIRDAPERALPILGITYNPDTHGT
ncbi:hypothetical protein [Priestia megaterium]